MGKPSDLKRKLRLQRPGKRERARVKKHRRGESFSVVPGAGTCTLKAGRKKWNEFYNSRSNPFGRHEVVRSVSRFGETAEICNATAHHDGEPISKAGTQMLNGQAVRQAGRNPVRAPITFIPEFTYIDDATPFTEKDWERLKALLPISRAREYLIEENTMSRETSAVIFITHSLVPVDALVMAINGDGTVALAMAAADTKRRKAFLSGDIAPAFDRETHAEHFASKLKRAVEAENAAAEKDGRDADFGNIDHVGLLQNSFAERGRVSLKGVIDDVTKSERVEVTAVAVTSLDGIPDPYRVPVAIPAPPEILPSAPAQRGVPAGVSPISNPTTGPVTPVSDAPPVTAAPPQQSGSGSSEPQVTESNENQAQAGEPSRQ